MSHNEVELSEGWFLESIYIHKYTMWIEIDEIKLPIFTREGGGGSKGLSKRSFCRLASTSSGAR